MRSTTPSKQSTRRARALRSSETRSEKLLWSLLRGKQLSNLKFRRQYPVSPFIVDFACIGEKLIVEIDGGYHDLVAENDMHRENYLRNAGWDVLRFTDKEVLRDVEAVGVAITRYAGVEFRLLRLGGRGAGMYSRWRV